MGVAVVVEVESCDGVVSALAVCDLVAPLAWAPAAAVPRPGPPRKKPGLSESTSKGFPSIFLKRETWRRSRDL